MTELLLVVGCVGITGYCLWVAVSARKRRPLMLGRAARAVGVAMSLRGGLVGPSNDEFGQVADRVAARLGWSEAQRVRLANTIQVRQIGFAAIPYQHLRQPHLHRVRERAPEIGADLLERLPIWSQFSDELRPTRRSEVGQLIALLEEFFYRMESAPAMDVLRQIQSQTDDRYDLAMREAAVGVLQESYGNRVARSKVALVD